MATSPKKKVFLTLADDQMCFGCGSLNPRGLRLHFTLDSKKKRLKSRWTPTKEFQGYQDILHGGILGLILDEMMVNLLWKLNRPSVTAKLEVRFLQPAKVDEPIDFEAHIGSQEGRVTRMQAKAATAAGKAIAQASAMCIQLGNSDSGVKRRRGPGGQP